MKLFNLVAILTTLAAVFGYLNYRWLRLPATIGVLALALVSSLVTILFDEVVPGAGIREAAAGILQGIDFHAALMHGMLCFLLFAGALHLDWGEMRANGVVVGVLSTLGVLISTVVVGVGLHLLLAAIHQPLPLPVCLVFGALISPTDPVAVLGLLKDLRAPRDVTALMAGESLFNDGVGIVLFVGCAGLAGVGTGDGAAVVAHPAHLALFFAEQVGGGVLLGAIAGYVAYRALKSIDYHPLELLITFALVMFVYGLAFACDASGPIAVVVAGIIIGNPGKKWAMSENTRRYLEAFWDMVDEILNAILFLLLGLQSLAISWRGGMLLAGLLLVPLVLLARLVSVAAPMAVLRRARTRPGLTAVLTWGGLRGGISVALLLSVSEFPGKPLLEGLTYIVVVFSVLVQGTTMPRLLRHYALSSPKDGAGGHE
jgi:CPA1 family monovalent cation:H+ antiporter